MGLISIGIKIGQFQHSFNNLANSLNQINPVVVRLNSCVQELQSVMKNKYKKLAILQETIDLYGIANSPIVLKEEFRDYIQSSGLANQIEEKKIELSNWLKKKKPTTGLDAQEILLDFVISDEVEKYLDTREFKRLLYESGKTLKDHYIILAIYLFETIIPEVISTK
jgi:hypothetical protein